MAKRSSQGTDGAAAFRKRQKLTQEVAVGEDVTSSEHLRGLLTFDQDMRNARHGLQSLKKFLDDIVSTDEDRPSKLALLKEYLESVKPRDAASEDAIHMHDIMDMWSFAIQANDEGVMSAVVVVLALLLQIISDSLHLVPYGNGICQTLLQEPQLKAIAKHLASEKSKGFIISPTLRLLREAVCLDGGAYAKRFVRARTYTFTALGRNLEVGHTGDNPEDARKASIRANAVRFFLSCLKFLHSEGRRELLSQKDLLSHLTYMMKNDPPHLVLEVLESLKAHVLMDSKIPREIKFRAFNTKMLMRLLSLYTYAHATADPDERELVCERAHQFLVHVCTTPTSGILYPYRGLYPKEADDEFSALSARRGSDDESGDPWEGKLREGVPVYNFILSEFASKLRPWSSLKHCELLVAIFTAAPELISNYFYNNQSFTFEPKLSMTWIGYAAFLFNTMMIPLPASFGDPTRYAAMPPPTSIILDNIIPRPVTQKVLIRCLSPQARLTSFFATRILVAALEKLSTALRLLEGPCESKNTLWADASRRIVDMFCQRIPDMKEVVRCYKGIPAENVLHKTLTSRLLRLYYEVVPRVALAANFDVSLFFVGVLKNLDETDSEAERKKLGAMELENLVSIASYSPGMRWFAKLESLGQGQGSSSPFCALLKLLCSGGNDTPLNELKTVLGDVAVESQVVTGSAALKPLLQALTCASDAAGSAGTASIWPFLDNCISRCATSPIKYLDLMKDHASRDDGSATAEVSSLLHAAIIEQLPFVLGTADPETATHLATFISLYFHAVQLASKDDGTLSTLYKEAEKHFASASTPLAALGDGTRAKMLKKCHVKWQRSKPTARKEPVTLKRTLSQEALEELLHTPFSSAEDATVLAKWASKSVEDMVEDGHAAGLIRLLASEHINLRKEAITSILKMAAQIKESSTYEEKMQIWLLLSEVAESSKALVDRGPVPSAFTAFTTHSLDVVKNPLHPLYPKVNSYLTRSPVWGPDKLPLAHDILHGTPSEDDKYYTELTWLLAYLLDSLRTPFDLGIFHKKRWFEKVLALGSNPYLRSALRTRLLRLVYRATCIEAGSTTLITRFGLISWLDARRVACDVEDEVVLYEALMRRAWATCDQGRVRAWSKGGVEQLLETISDAK